MAHFRIWFGVFSVGFICAFANVSNASEFSAFSKVTRACVDFIAARTDTADRIAGIPGFSKTKNGKNNKEYVLAKKASGFEHGFFVRSYRSKTYRNCQMQMWQDVTQADRLIKKMENDLKRKGYELKFNSWSNGGVIFARKGQESFALSYFLSNAVFTKNPNPEIHFNIEWVYPCGHRVRGRKILTGPNCPN